MVKKLLLLIYTFILIGCNVPSLPPSTSPLTLTLQTITAVPENTQPSNLTPLPINILPTIALTPTLSPTLSSQPIIVPPENTPIIPTPSSFIGESELISIALVDTNWYTATQIIKNIENLTQYAFSPDGEILATGYFVDNETQGVLTLWDIQTGQEIWSYSSPEVLWARIYFSPNSQFVATATHFWLNSVKIWEISSEEMKYNLSFDASNVEILNFSTNNQFLGVSTSTDPYQAVGWVVDLTSGGKEIRDIVSQDVVFIPNSANLIIAQGIKRELQKSPLLMLNLVTEEIEFLPIDIFYSDNIALSPQGNILVANGYPSEDSAENYIFLWDLVHQREIKRINLGENLDWKLVFSPTNFFGVVTDRVFIWDANGNTVAEFLPEIAYDFEFTPDGKYLLTKNEAGFQIWLLPEKQPQSQ